MKAIILTKSEMKAHNASGHCTVAYDFVGEKIVRLVSNADGGPISGIFSKRYECLDVVDFSILEKCPKGPQQENVMIYMKSIRKIRKFEGDFEIIYHAYQKWIQDESLYMNIAEHSLESVEEYHHSIEILKVTNLETSLDQWENTKAAFDVHINGSINKYRQYTVKDPHYNLKYKNIPNEKIGTAYVIVSIPYLPFEKDERYHKLIAAVYPVSDVSDR